MLIKHLKPIDLLVVTDRQKNANGTYTDIYSLKQSYNVKVQELNDEISAQAYGADIVKMLKIGSPLKDLEKYLLTKVQNKEDNISKYKFRLDGTDYRIKAVKISGVDIERY